MIFVEVVPDQHASHDPCMHLAAFSLKPPSFRVARRAQMTPSEEARKILGESADDRTIIKLVDFVVQTREAKAQADAREAKAQADAREAKAQADAREAKAHQVHLEQDKLRLETELFCVLHRA